MFTIGLDIGGTKIAAGLVDESGRLVRTVRRETPATDPSAIEDAAADAVAELSAGRRVVAVGVAAAGFVDVTRSCIVFAPNLAWRDEPMRTDLESRTGLPVVVENDANAAAWAEYRYGAGHGADDMVLVTVGTGLGGGVVVGGRLLRGHSGFASELGHVRVVPDGHRCGCGNKGCWEQYASGRALVREARELAATDSPVATRLLELAGGRSERIEGPHVTQAATEGDAAAVELFTDLGTWLGEGIASIVAVLDPSVIVVGGGVADAGDLLLDPARAAFRRQLTARGYRPEARIEKALLGNTAGMVGAADLARSAGRR